MPLTQLMRKRARIIDEIEAGTRQNDDAWFTSRAYDGPVLTKVAATVDELIGQLRFMPELYHPEAPFGGVVAADRLLATIIVAVEQLATAGQIGGRIDSVTPSRRKRAEYRSPLPLQRPRIRDEIATLATGGHNISGKKTNRVAGRSRQRKPLADHRQGKPSSSAAASDIP
jgi:hypothetical protein